MSEREMTKKDLYNFRKVFVNWEWQDYLQTSDRRHLANICNEMPFFENDEVGAEIAKLLTLDYHLAPLPKKAALDKIKQDTEIKAYWLTWKGSTDEKTGEKIPEDAIMAHIGYKVGIIPRKKDSDAKNMAAAVRQRLKKLGLK